MTTPGAREELLRRLRMFGVDMREVEEAIESHPQHVVAQKRFGPLLGLAYAVQSILKEAHKP